VERGSKQSHRDRGGGGRGCRIEAQGWCLTGLLASAHGPD
jgi:hypothetical protein